jgi:hypothetical protein
VRSSSFLEKGTKKALSPTRKHPEKTRQQPKSLLVLFFRKELLAHTEDAFTA